MNIGKVVIITDGNYKGRIGSIIDEKNNQYVIKLVNKNVESFLNRNKQWLKKLSMDTLQIDHNLKSLVAGRKSRKKTKKQTKKKTKKKTRKKTRKKTIKINKTKVKLLSIII